MWTQADYRSPPLWLTHASIVSLSGVGDNVDDVSWMDLEVGLGRPISDVCPVKDTGRNLCRKLSRRF